jgi:type IV secretion/conjugal transfer VirB4 family ATPase
MAWEFLKSIFLEYYSLLKTHHWEKLPLLCPLSDNTTILNKDGTLTKVIKISGVDYNGMSQDKQHSLNSIRSSVLKRGSGFVLSYYILRFRQKAVLEPDEYDNPISTAIADTWSESFTNVFVTNHYLAISTKTNVLKTLAKKRKKKKTSVKKKGINGEETDLANASQRKLDETAEFIKSSLTDYNAQILEGGELFAFFYTLINSDVHDNVNPNSDTFDQWLMSNAVEFKELSKHFTYLNSGKVSSFITVKNFPEFAVQAVFDNLIQTNVEMIITQHCELLDQDVAKRLTHDKLRIFESFSKFNQLILNDLYDLISQLEADHVRLATHYITIQVISEDIGKHSANINEVTKLLQRNGYVTSVEILNNEPLYYSQFPALRKSNVRQKRLTTDNLVDFFSFSTSGTGHKRCSFGESPTAHFTSIDGNIYNFIFHITESQNALGHTLIIGDTGTGKTTLISFLLSLARKYEGMKMVLFDQLRGQEIATRMQDGDYINFEEDSFIINPLLLDDTTHNRSFMLDFLCDMVDADPDEERIISKELDTLFDWKPENKKLDEITNIFTQVGTKFHDKLAKWQTGGIHQGFFNGNSNDFNFDNLLTCFDFTSIIKQEKILGLLTSYLSHMFFSQSDGSPRIIFVDEFRRYLESDIFSKIIQRFLEEFRKLNGIFIAAIQNINQLYDDPIGRRNIANFGKFVIYPISGNLNREAYEEGIGLNDSEINWLKTADIFDRKVMIKTKGGSSTIVDVDLKYLGKYLKVFDSSAQNVKKLKNIMQEHPDDFREVFLNS